ncbi:hypothetical protein MYX78_08250 [Acidobacteria bacterium AH-259-G07]|nr:hypothetical protein [Acidobacteria bacterium AH-259-G07]
MKIQHISAVTLAVQDMARILRVAEVDSLYRELKEKGLQPELFLFQGCFNFTYQSRR